MDASTRSPSVTTACRFGSKVIVKECVAQTAVAVPTCREAGPAASADDLPRDESEEDDREHDQERHERRRPRLARQRAEERAEPTEARPGEHEPETEERQPDPRLAARHAAHVDDHAEGERDREP